MTVARRLERERIRQILPNTSGCTILRVGVDFTYEVAIVGWAVTWVFYSDGDSAIFTLAIDANGNCEGAYDVVLHPNGVCTAFEEEYISKDLAITATRARILEDSAKA